MAKRLSEIQNVSVALIEAGYFYEYDNNNVSQIVINSNSAPDPANIQPLIDWDIISSASTTVNPAVNPAYLSTLTDRVVAIVADKRATELTKAVDYTTGSSAPALTLEDDILQFMKTNIAQFYRAAGTATVGKQGGKDAVADTKGRVIFRLTPPAHNKSAVYALAEKLAGDIAGGR